MHKLWTMLLVGAAGCCVMTSAQSGYAQFEVNEALLDKIENAELMKNLANDAETENQTSSDESKDGAVSESAQDENQKEKKFEVFAFGRGFDCKDPFGFISKRYLSAEGMSRRYGFSRRGRLLFGDTSKWG